MRMAWPRPLFDLASETSLRLSGEDENADGTGRACDVRRTEYWRSQTWMWMVEDGVDERAAMRTWWEVSALIETALLDFWEVKAKLANLNGRARGRSWGGDPEESV